MWARLVSAAGVAAPRGCSTCCCGSRSGRDRRDRLRRAGGRRMPAAGGVVGVQRDDVHRVVVGGARVLLPRATTAVVPRPGPCGAGVPHAVRGRQPDRHRRRRRPDRRPRLPRAERLRLLIAYLATAGALAGSWIVHNLVVSGQPLGPRFEGGTTDRWDVLLRRPFTSLGHTLFGDSLDIDPATTAGSVAVVVIAVAGLLWQYRRTIDALAPACWSMPRPTSSCPYWPRADVERHLVQGDVTDDDPHRVRRRAGGRHRGARTCGVAVVALVTALWIWQGLALVERVPTWRPVGAVRSTRRNSTSSSTNCPTTRRC